MRPEIFAHSADVDPILSRSQIRILMRCFVTKTMRLNFGKPDQKALLLVQPAVLMQHRMAYLTKSVIY